jgi:DNA-binding transcriptional ArsR family regulator
MGDAIDDTLLALADPTRRAVVSLLSEGPRRAGALAEALSLSPPAMSRHLRVLRKARLVEEQALEEDARVRVYRLRPEPLRALGTWVDEVSAFWGEQLLAFKEHAEGRATKQAVRAKGPAKGKAERPSPGAAAAGRVAGRAKAKPVRRNR